MSRFGTYLDTQKLAKMMLQEAKLALAKKDDGRALRAFITVINCLASMQFERKAKRGRPPKARP